MLKKISFSLSISILISGMFTSMMTNAETYYGSGYQNQNQNNGYVYYGDGNSGNTTQMKERYYFPDQNNIQRKPISTNQRVTNTSNSKIFYKTGAQPCWDKAAAYHNVDPWLLMSIAKVESSFNPNAYNGNKNGSYDLGMMQINSIWFPRLRKMGISQEMLKDACTSTYVGAWILSHNIKRYGYTWRAIGAYNSANPVIGLKYAKKVYAAHAQLTGYYAMNNWK